MKIPKWKKNPSFRTSPERNFTNLSNIHCGVVQVRLVCGSTTSPHVGDEDRRSIRSGRTLNKEPVIKMSRCRCGATCGEGFSARHCRLRFVPVGSVRTFVHLVSLIAIMHRVSYMFLVCRSRCWRPQSVARDVCNAIFGRSFDDFLKNFLNCDK